MNKNDVLYLTEHNLGKFLLMNFNDGIWIHDKKFVGRSRPDYRNDKLKLIVEFNGHQHYTSSKRIVQDEIKLNEETKLGYKVVEIPYFVQLSTDVCKILFDVELKIEQKYPHGFIDDKCILPADFCELGIERFKSDIKKFACIKNEIVDSLKTKHKTLKNKKLVLPLSLFYML